MEKQKSLDERRKDVMKEYGDREDLKIPGDLIIIGGGVSYLFSMIATLMVASYNSNRAPFKDSPLLSEYRSEKELSEFYQEELNDLLDQHKKIERKNNEKKRADLENRSFYGMLWNGNGLNQELNPISTEKSRLEDNLEESALKMDSIMQSRKFQANREYIDNHFTEDDYGKFVCYTFGIPTLFVAGLFGFDGLLGVYNRRRRDSQLFHLDKEENQKKCFPTCPL